MPPFRFLASSTQGLGFSPVIPLADVPGIHLNNHLIGLQHQLRLHRLGTCTPGLLILLTADLPCPFSLASRFPIQRQLGQLDSRQVLQHGAGLAHRHLAGQQRCHLLHPRRIARCLLQSQRRVGRKPPLVAPFAVAPAPPNGDRPKPALKAPPVIARQTAQRFMAHRTHRRGHLGLLLRGLFGRHAQQFPALLLYLNLDVAQVLIAHDQKVAHVLFQSIGQARCRDRQRLRWLGVMTHTGFHWRACRIHGLLLMDHPAHYPATVRADRHGVNGTFMPIQDDGLGGRISCPQIPQARGVVVTAGDHPAAVRAECQRTNPILMPFEHNALCDRIGRPQIPQDCGVVVTAGDHPAAVRAERNR